MDVTIVIPTKNAGTQIERVLDAVQKQKTNLEYEVICVDSGSKDSTLESISKYSFVKLYEIAPDEFGHGKTRNYGASKGSGEFIVFITQDALPASDKWLENLVSAVADDPICAGGFGIHYPYPECNLFDKRDLKLHFEGFGKQNTYYWITDWKRYHEDEGYRHLLAFYSDNNSCMRRSIWEKYPYADVNFAEDQIWARQMIELGYHKVYVADAPVYHSHNYKMTSYFGRYFDEYKGLYELHKFIILPTRWLILPAWLKHIVMDFRYVNQCRSSLTLSERCYWRWYSVSRNWCRYVGGWLGGNYHRYSEKKKLWLDKHISQQYHQIHE